MMSKSPNMSEFPALARSSAPGFILIVLVLSGLAFAQPALAQPGVQQPGVQQPGVQQPGVQQFEIQWVEIQQSGAQSGKRMRSPVSRSAYAAENSVPVSMEANRWMAADPGVFCRAPLSGLDRRGLQVLYCAGAPVVTRPLIFAHRSSYPVFYTAVPTAWLGAWIVRGTDDFSDAYRLTLTQGATYLTVIGLKGLFKRPRPFMSIPSLSSRSSHYGRTIADGQFASLPSGHAALSVALATSWSLSHPYWYVIAPSALWAGAVSLSRLHLGVHYPSDILLGAVLGVGIATGIHLLRDSITPSRLKPAESGDSISNGIDPAAAMATGPTIVLFRTRF